MSMDCATNSEHGRETEFLADASTIEELFGSTARFYVPLVRQILPQVFRVTYEFEDTRVFEKKVRHRVYAPEEINRIVWREIVLRAHMVVSASLYRTCRLIDATVREHRASNLPGWASCARALLEATGDSVHTLRAIPDTLAEHHRFIRRCLFGQERQLSGSTELEARMFHFTHAGHLKGKEKEELSPLHRAKPAIGYISELGMPDARALYGELCDCSHPAASSVEYLFSAVDEGGAFKVDPRRDRQKIDSLVCTYREVFDNLLMVSFNLALLSLRVFHVFRLFPNILELRDVNFSDIPAWATIEKHLKS